MQDSPVGRTPEIQEARVRILDLSVIISPISVIRNNQLLSYKVKHLPVQNTEKNNHFIIQVIKLNVHNMWGK